MFGFKGELHPNYHHDDSQQCYFFFDLFSTYSTAGRMIKTGLTASVIVSQWTWAATLLQSSNVAWAYGVSGPFWYVPSSLFVL